MNVYDFDNTILRGDSTARFFAWCLLRAPRMWLDAPGQIVNAILFLLKKREKQAFKERMLSFLTRVDVDRQLERFWEKNLSRVKPFLPGTASLGRRGHFRLAGISHPSGLRGAGDRARARLAGGQAYRALFRAPTATA